MAASHAVSYSRELKNKKIIKALQQLNLSRHDFMFRLIDSDINFDTMLRSFWNEIFEESTVPKFMGCSTYDHPLIKYVGYAICADNCTFIRNITCRVVNLLPGLNLLQFTLSLFQRSIIIRKKNFETSGVCEYFKHVNLARDDIYNAVRVYNISMLLVNIFSDTTEGFVTILDSSIKSILFRTQQDECFFFKFYKIECLIERVNALFPIENDDELIMNLYNFKSHHVFTAVIKCSNALISPWFLLSLRKSVELLNVLKKYFFYLVHYEHSTLGTIFDILLRTYSFEEFEKFNAQVPCSVINVTIEKEKYMQFLKYKECKNPQIEDIPENFLCKICISSEMSTMIIPCGHVFCQYCIVKFNNVCAMCRSPITGSYTIYLK